MKNENYFLKILQKNIFFTTSVGNRSQILPEQRMVQVTSQIEFKCFL
jgi:hypothetical protein